MPEWLHNFWEGFVKPMFRRPLRVQVAALCTRDDGSRTEVLLITSRDTGRWIIPKGWPIDGLDGAGSAQQEAWEEAGVRSATADREPLGQYTYGKVLNDGSVEPLLTHVYRLRVTELADDFPEARERTREWVSPTEAAGRVAEPELQNLLRRI